MKGNEAFSWYALGVGLGAGIMGVVVLVTVVGYEGLAIGGGFVAFFLAMVGGLVFSMPLDDTEALVPPDLAEERRRAADRYQAWQEDEVEPWPYEDVHRDFRNCSWGFPSCINCPIKDCEHFLPEIIKGG